MSDQQLYLIQHYRQDPKIREQKGRMDAELRELVEPCDWEGYHKIGISNNVPSRLSMLQSGTPHDLNLLTTIDMDGDAKVVEKKIHEELHHCNVRGEWFDLHPKFVSWFIERDRISKAELKEFQQFRQEVYLEDE